MIASDSGATRRQTATPKQTANGLRILAGLLPVMGYGFGASLADLIRDRLTATPQGKLPAEIISVICSAFALFLIVISAYSLIGSLARAAEAPAIDGR